MKFIRQFSVRTRLLVALLCVSILPAVFVGTYSTHMYTDLVTKELSDYTVQTIQHMDTELTMELWRYGQFIDQISISEDVQRAMIAGRNDMTMRKAVENYLIRVGYFRGIHITDINGDSLYDDGFIQITDAEMPAIIAGVDAASTADSIYHSGSNLIIGRKIFRYPQGNEHIGYIFAFVNDALPRERVFNKVSFGDGSVMLLSGDGNVLSASPSMPDIDFDNSALYEQLMANLDQQSFTMDVNGVPSFVVFSKSSRYDTYLLATIPLSHINEGTTQMRWQLIFIVIAITLLCVALSLLIYRSVASPIHKMIAKCNGAQTISADNSPDELGYLARTIDTYTEDLQHMSQLRTLDQRRKRELELDALQYQINPHFLFNTLNTLKWVSVINEAPAIISEGITSLSQLLNSVLMNKNELVTVRNELENLAHYFTIQRIRYADCFRVQQRVDEGVMESLIPRFILQPLVENAVLHGAAGSGRQILISVCCQRVPEGVLLEISDDGNGFDVATIKNRADGKFSGIGLSNVDERLKLYFGEQHGLTVISTPGEGTVCRVLIPNKTQEER